MKITEKGFFKIYLDFLERTGRASIKTISLATNMDEKFIKEYIEPFLIKRNLKLLSTHEYSDKRYYQDFM